MIYFYRLARWLFSRGVPVLPRLIYIFNRIVFSVVLPPSAEVGRKVVFDYSMLGIVVHKRAHWQQCDREAEPTDWQTSRFYGCAGD